MGIQIKSKNMNEVIYKCNGTYEIVMKNGVCLQCQANGVE